MAQWEDVARELVAARYGTLVGYARLVAGPRDAEDIVQEALIATFSKPRGLTSVPVAEAYVRRAIVTRFLDQARRRSRAATDSVESVDVAVASATDLVADSLDLGAALSRLAPRERACVALRYLDGLSVSETARVLGLAEGSVRRYVSDGIAKLSGILGTEDVVDDASFVRVSRGGAR